MFKILGNQLAQKGFFINLEQSTNRLAKVNELIKIYNIEGLERFNALYDSFVQYSCTKSHLAVFQKALEEDLDVIFVAEDDFHIDELCYKGQCEKVPLNEVLGNIVSDLSSVEWDVVTLGCNPKSHLIPVTNNLAIVDNSTGGWGYLIKKNAYKYLLENLNYYKDYMAIDDYLPMLNGKGFRTLTTIPMVIGHSTGFESTLQPRGPVDYTPWIYGNYQYYLYDNYPNCEFMENRIEKELTVIITGHFVKDYLFYLKYLLHSLPDTLQRCKFLIVYDYDPNAEQGMDLIHLQDYFKNEKSHLNISILTPFGGLISSFNEFLKELRTPYFLFLEHDWVFMRKDSIDFTTLLDVFNKHDYIHAVWFNKDDNILRGYEIEADITGTITPFEVDVRIPEVNLISTVRWSNNPAIFRTSKMREWYDNHIRNEYVGTNHQGCYNVEDTMIPLYRQTVRENKWEDIRDNWGTYLYGGLNEGPFVAHLDGSRKYQGSSHSQPEINGEEYIKNNPMI